MTSVIQRKNAFIVQNIEREGLGIIKNILEERGIRYDVCLASDATLYPDPDYYSHIFILGGPDSANDDTEKMRRELQFAEKCISYEVPTLGICLGLQVLGKAAGAEVHLSMYNGQRTKEIGFRSVRDPYLVFLTPEGKNDAVFSGIDSIFPVFQLHGETVEIPENGVLLAGGGYCRNQAIRIGKNARGLQFHIETTANDLERLLCEDDDLKRLNRNKVLADYEMIKKGYEATGRRIIENFLSID